MTHTSARVWQWTGIILILCLFGGAYWYFKVYGSTLNQSQNDLNTNGLVGLWSFNGDDMSGATAYDRSGSGNNGTLTNGPVATQGKVGQALDFDGTNDYVATTDYSFSNAQAFTMSVWFKADTVSGNQVIFSKATYEYNLRLIGSTLAFSYWDTGALDEIGLSYSNVQANKWYQISVTYDGSGIAYMYVDGVRVASDTNIVDAFQNRTDVFQIGGGYHVSGSPGYLNGQIDEVRIYNRALSAGEIQSLYAQGSGTKSNTSISQAQGTGRLDSGLAGYWALDEGSGTSATDSSTNGNTGTLIFGPTWGAGQVGGGVDMDGDNDYISIGDPASGVLDFGTDNFSVSFWMNGAGYTDQIGSRNTAVSKRADSSTNANGYTFLYPSTNLMEFHISNGSATYTAAHNVATASDNQWHHYVGTRTGSTMNLYVDGSVVATTSGVTGSVSSSTSLQIGDSGTQGTRNSNALFDEVRIYNRSLSADEVAQLYRLNAPSGTDTGLKGYWSFNGKDMSSTSAYDRSGAGNTGTLTNGPAVTRGKLGQALSFDGGDDYVNVPDSTALSPSAALTVSFWANITSSISSQCRTFLAKNASGQRSWALTTTTSGGVVFYVATNTNDTGTFGSTGGGLIAQNQWAYVTVVFDGAGSGNADRAKIYVNGVQSSVTFTGTIPASLTDTSQAVRFGEAAMSCTALPGYLDEVRMYNRALTAGEIKGLYDVGADDKVNSAVSQAQGTGRLDSGLAGYWKLDDGSGTSATDSSTNGYTGTLTNGPTWTTGQIGGAVTFDGVDDYIDTDNDVALDSLYELSYSAWIYPTASDGYILGKRTNGGGTEGFRLTSGTLQGWVANWVAASAGRATSSTAVSLNTWSLVTMTYSKAGDNKPHLYINGTEVAYSEQDTLSGHDPEPSYDFYIGRIQDNPELSDVPYTGKIDDVRIYNRALSTDEVRQLYQLTAVTGTDTGLKGYWSFNGQDVSGTTAYDRSGAGNTGTLTNGPAITEGKIGQGLSFDGSDDYVDLGDVSTMESQSVLTISAWINPITLTDYAGIVSKYTSPTSDTTLNLGGGGVGSSSALSVTLRNGSDAYGYTASGKITAGTWIHCVLVFDGTQTGNSNRLKAYINGSNETLTYVGTIPSTTVANTQNLRIGRTGAASNYFNGKIDEVRVYNRALTEAEIKSLYNASR